MLLKSDKKRAKVRFGLQKKNQIKFQQQWNSLESIFRLISFVKHKCVKYEASVITEEEKEKCVTRERLMNINRIV